MKCTHSNHRKKIHRHVSQTIELYGKSVLKNKTAECYFDFLAFALVLALVVVFPNEVDSDIHNERIMFQQFGVNAKEYLDRIFTDWWTR